MIFKVTERTNYPVNANRKVPRFAWLPVYISGNMVWLQRYLVLQIYTIEVGETIIGDKPMRFAKYKWVDFSKDIL